MCIFLKIVCGTIYKWQDFQVDQKIFTSSGFFTISKIAWSQISFSPVTNGQNRYKNIQILWFCSKLLLGDVVWCLQSPKIACFPSFIERKLKIKKWTENKVGFVS